MSTATTQDQTLQRTSPPVIYAGQLVALVCGIAVLAAFVALPWLTEAEVNATGATLLTSQSLPFSAEASEGLVPTQASLIFVPAAAMIALGAALWGVFAPRYRSVAANIVPLAGLIGLTYFLVYFTRDRESPVAMMARAGGGYWIALFSLVGLALLAVILRPPASSEVGGLSVLFPGFMSRWHVFTDRYTRGLTQHPRFKRALVFVFRFQSFFGLIIVLALAIAASPIRNGNNIFLSQRNLSNVTRDVAETGVLAVGQILVILIGGIDLSVGSMVALTATGVAFLLMRDLVPAVPAVLIILGMGLFIGWWNGWISERFKIPPFIATLAMYSIARGIAHIWSDDIAVPLSYEAGGADPLFGLIGERINGVFPVPAIIMFIVAIIMGLVLHYTSFGRHIYAIGGNQIAARLSGVAVSRVKITAFMLCSFFASMAGILHAAQLNQGSPNEGMNYEMNAIAAVVIGGATLSGGKGTIAGAIAGAFIMGILDNMLSLNNVNSNAQLISKGLLVIAAVALQQFRPRDVE